MAAGLPIVQASSEVWPENGSMGQRALNSGWVLDQRFDGSGGFLTNTSPTSSGKTFQSTGDATPFYLKGRTIQVVQGGATIVATVGQSSNSGGITSVFINQFSTASGLSTTLTTGAITSVAASPHLAGSTGNMFGGAIPNNTTGGTQAFLMTPLAIGSSAATRASSGVILLPYSTSLIIGVTSTGGNDTIYPMQVDTTSLGADVPFTTTAGTYAVVFNRTLPVGTWLIQAGFTVTDTGGNVQQMSGRLVITGTVLASVFDSNAVGGGAIYGASTSVGKSYYLSIIASHSTALGYSLQVTSVNINSTSAKVKANNPGGVADGPATYWNAVKIG